VGLHVKKNCYWLEILFSKFLVAHIMPKIVFFNTRRLHILFNERQNHTFIFELGMFRVISAIMKLVTPKVLSSQFGDLTLRCSDM